MKKDDNKNFLNDFFEFLDSDSGETLEELKEELKEEGINFDVVYARFQGDLSKVIQKRKAEIREQEKEVMHRNLDELEKLKQMEKLPTDRASIMEEIKLILESSIKAELSFAHRNFNTTSDEDLKDILSELRTLINPEKK